ncbi:MAG: SWIM zinc finger family protein [Holophagales bacterium]|nr:SWIM zinc finger family protein [Holophagales bacterium]
MLLNAVLRDEFDPVIRGRGEDYFRRGRIRSSVGNDVAVIAKVSGSRDYTVNVGRIGDEVELSCTCPYFEGDGACKHLWAVLLFAEAEGFLRGDGRPVRKVTLTDSTTSTTSTKTSSRRTSRTTTRTTSRSRSTKRSRGSGGASRRLRGISRGRTPSTRPRTGLRFGLRSGLRSGPRGRARSSRSPPPHPSHWVARWSGRRAGSCSTSSTWPPRARPGSPSTSSRATRP